MSAVGVDERFAALTRAIEEAMVRYHVPGVALGLVDGETEQVAGFGVTGVEHPLPVDGDTLFPIASITKTVVATAMLRLVERGHLALDAPVQRYLPELRLHEAATTSRLTMAHLLTHTGGFQGDVRDGEYGVRCGSGEDALARFVAMLAHLPQYAPPGELWAYNNAGFSLAGRMIEVATGQTFEAAIRALVLEPLGMRRSGFMAARVPASATPSLERVAGGHHGPGGRRSPTPWRWGTPFGRAARRPSTGRRYRRCCTRPAVWFAPPATCCATRAFTWETAAPPVASGCSRPSRSR